MKTRCCCPTA